MTMPLSDEIQQPTPLTLRDFEAAEEMAVSCQKCGARFLTRYRCKPYCDPCVEHLSAPAEIQGCHFPAQALAWQAFCPREYRTTAEEGVTDLQRLKSECPKLPKVLAWQYGAKGLLIRGATGRGKTRSIWRLMRRLWEEGRTLMALSSGDLARQYADACGRFTRAEWFAKLSDADVLFLDDLGRSEWSAGVWAEFFELIDARAKQGRPVLMTTNETAESLRVKCKDPVTWEPLERRLREHCQGIVL